MQVADERLALLDHAGDNTDVLAQVLAARQVVPPLERPVVGHAAQRHAVFRNEQRQAVPAEVTHEKGEPFVGRAGQLLNNMIKAMGIEREQVYIANIVKCRPPGNRQPEREECETCSPFLMRQIAVVKPKVIVALGATAAKTLLAMNSSMMQLRGRFYDFKPAGVRGTDEWDGCKLAVTYHPAFLLRDPRQKGEAWKDLQMVMKELGMKGPKANA